MIRQTGGARARLDQASEPLLTGKKVSRPSQDPTHARRLMASDRGLSRVESFRNTIARQQLYNQVAETTVTQVVGVLDDMNALALAMGNDSMDADARALAVAELDTLIDSMKSMSNAKFNGRHIFAGRTQDAPAYDADGNFVGDAQGRTIRIGEGQEVAGDITGPTIFGQAGSSAFEAAEALRQALLDNDSAAIGDAMEKVQAAHEHATHGLSKVGFAMSQLHKVDLAHEETSFTQQLQRAELDEVDISKAASEMAFAEHVYSVAIQTAQQLNRILDMETRL